MNVKIFRLVSGEELIGKWENDNDDSIDVENPAVIVLNPSQQGVQMGLMPFMAYAQDKIINFKKSHIVATCAVETPLLNEYNRIFGSGIEIANANDKLLKG